MSLMDQINLERVTAERDVALAAWIDAQVRIVALTEERDLLRVFRAEVIAERDAALAAVEVLTKWQRAICDHFGYDSADPENVTEVLTFLPYWQGEAAGIKEHRDELLAAVERVRALTESMVWKRPKVSPCAPNFEHCCGTEASCDAMQPSTYIVGPEQILRALDGE